MHPLVKHRKHINRFVLAALIITILFVAVTLILSYRIKEVAEQLVNQQTNGAYELKIKKLHLSLLRGRVELENAQITHDDSSGNRFIVQLPAMYFVLNSWKELIVKKKLSFDSVMLTQPSFEVYEESSDTQKQKTIFQTIRIVDAINKAVDLFDVRSFHLVNGSFIYHAEKNAPPFESHNINISIRNFARDTNDSHRFLSSDDFEISIGEQDWKLADNTREIKFKELHFSGKKQTFELDSLQFSSRAADGQGALTLDIASLAFTSKHLSAFYENNEVLIDTLRCIRPVLQLRVNKDTASIDTSSVISESLQSIFANIHINHFDIREGQFTIDEKAGGKSSQYTTEKTNLRIDDLDIRPGDSAFLTMGAVDLKLNDIHFYTRDSLYQLTVEEFDLFNGDLRFKNAFFSPTSNNREQESFFIRIPILVFKNLDLKELLEKRLVAEAARMESPVVTIQSRGEKKKDNTVSGNLEGFYDGLEGLSELMEVKMLVIKNSRLNYKSLIDSSLHMNVSGFNVSVSLNDFLRSKSLQDIKHSIPYVEAAAITFRSRTLSADITHIGLLNDIHRNMIDKIELTLANGMTLKGKKLLWKKLNWDELKNRNAIVADSINIDELEVKQDEKMTLSDKGNKDLPVISIRKLGVNEFKLSYAFSDEGQLEAKAKGKNVLFTELSSQGKNLFWQNAKGTFTNFEYKSPSVTASSNKVKFEAPGKIRFSGIELNTRNSTQMTYIYVRDADIETTIASTDFSHLDFPSVIINEPELTVTQNSVDHSAAEPLKIPFDFAAGSVHVNRGQISYRRNHQTDSLQISSVVNVSLDSLTASKQDKSLRFSKMNFSLSKVMVESSKLNVTFPSLEFTAADGNAFDDAGKTTFESIISGNWKHATLHLPLKKDSKVEVTNFSGKLSKLKLELKPLQKFDWQQWADKINVQSARVQFSDSNRNVSAGNLKWSASKGELEMDSVILQPKMTREEFFTKTPFQSDYIALKGGSVTISGIDFQQWQNDTVFRVNKISCEDVAIDVWRDRRKPTKHSNEKLMPAQLINSIGYRFSLDSVTLKNGDITYHEFSSITGREGIVPLKNISATMQHVTNIHTGNDTLTIRGKAKFLGSSIKKFRYSEAYNDSLGSFRLSVKASPIELNELSEITNPLAAVNINGGVLDTMLVRISGNKYAAIGEMNFYYHDLKVSFLDKEDATQKRISLSFVNFVANRFVIKGSNSKQSRIFYIRDREKFVFNYWIKSIMSGMLTSAGVKSNNAYDKQYQKLKDHYAVPDLNF